MRFDHVGVATRDAAALAGLFGDLLGAPVAHEETFDGMRIVLLELDDGGYLELLEPEAGGTIADYLDREGSGIHHVALATDDVAAALDRARDLGIDLVDEEPRPGAWGHEVAFLHPGSTGGVLVEFVDPGD
jgi:methylmalonyl-CoA/ethylmalonyl-CoA epimerase